MQVRESEPRPFGFSGALGVSLLAHLLLLLFCLWLPLAAPPAAPIEPQHEASQTRISFNVSPPKFEREDPGGERPPAPSRRVVPPGEPLSLSRSPPTPAVGAARAGGDAPVRDDRPAPVSGTEIASAESSERAAKSAVADTGAPPLESASPSGTKARPPPTGFDVGRALQDFRRSMPNRRDTPVTGPTSGGSGSSNPGVREPGSPPPTGFGVGNLRFESGDFDWNDYGRQIYMIIWRAWHNRLYQTTNEFEKWAHREQRFLLDHATDVRFVIERSGEVTGIVQEAASGCEPLDRSALDALEEVILPRLPAAFPREREVVHARFIAQGDVLQMRTVLGHYKVLGLF